MLRSRLSSFVAVRLLCAEPIGEGDFWGTDLAEDRLCAESV